MEQQPGGGREQGALYDSEFPFPPEEGDESTPFQIAMHPSLSSAPTPTRLCFTASPAPSTPAGPAPFNPDDFFASPPHNPAGPRSRMTPECKRRLFLAPDASAALATPRATLTAPPPVFTPLRHALAAHAAGSPQPSSSSSFLTYGILSTPRGAAAAPGALPASAKKRGRPAFRDGLGGFGGGGVGGGGGPAGSPSISSFLSPHRGLLPGNSLLLPSPTSATPRGKLFQSSHVALERAPEPKPLDFMTPITPAAERTKCSCKASRCLKLYCPCFASSGMCADGCTCKNCQNSQATLAVVQEARQTVLARDPKAFQPKRRPAAAASAGGAADIHAKGCNCRKGCGKNYCVCRELRVSCGPRCTCSGPAGCLNGKDHAAEHAAAPPAAVKPAGSIGPAPAKFRNSLPDPKSPRRRAGAAARKITMQSLRASMPAPGPGAVKAEAAVLKQESVAPPGPHPAFVSPRSALFGSRKLDITPDRLSSFRGAGGAGGLFSTPNEMRRLNLPQKGAGGARTPFELPGDGKLLPSLNNNGNRGDGASADRKRRSALSVDEYRIAEAAVDLKGDGRNPLATPDRPPRADPGKENIDLAQPGLPGHDTPERLKPTGLAFATSPATGMRADPSPGSRFARPARGRPENARPPRILRVKMGSGRALRKFAIGLD